MNAVIVDLKGKYAAALDENGNIVKIPNAGYAPGQRIELHAVQPKRHASLKRFTAAAAAAALVLTVGTGTAFAMPYGTVSLEGDAAVEYTINCFDRVLSAKATNEAGEELLAELEESSRRFQPVEEAVAAAVELQAASAGEDMPSVQISAETRSERHTARLQEQLNLGLREEAPPSADRPEAGPEAQGNLPEPDGGRQGTELPEGRPDADAAARRDTFPDREEKENAPAGAGEIPPEKPDGEAGSGAPEFASGREPGSAGMPGQKQAGAERSGSAVVVPAQ